MDTTHALFDIAAFDRLEESTPREYLRALADAFGPDARLGDLLLAATERELEERYQDMEAFDLVADELAHKLATAEGLEDGSKEWARRSTDLHLGRYHAIRNERKAEREAITA